MNRYPDPLNWSFPPADHFASDDIDPDLHRTSRSGLPEEVARIAAWDAADGDMFLVPKFLYRTWHELNGRNR